MSKTLMDTNPGRPQIPASEAASPAAERTVTLLSDSDEKPLGPVHPPLLEILAGPQIHFVIARWLIYLALGFGVLFLYGAALRAVHPHRGGSVWWTMASELGLMVAAVVPGFVMALVERRPFGDFGLPSRGAFGPNFWVGALWGLGSLTLLMLVLRAAGVFYFGSLALHGARVAGFAAFYIVFFLMTGVFEDFLLRGYSQWILSKALKFWPAAVVLSVIFGALHTSNSGETISGVLAVVAIGLFFCLTLRRTGTLWWAVGFHMAWDWGESYLYSVPDSGTTLRGHLLNSSIHGAAWLTGGSAGPEGSYLVFGLIAVMWVLFSRVYPDVKYGVAQEPAAQPTSTTT